MQIAQTKKKKQKAHLKRMNWIFVLKGFPRARRSMYSVSGYCDRISKKFTFIQNKDLLALIIRIYVIHQLINARNHPETVCSA